MAEKEPKKRFKERRDRDDEDDERPVMRSRRDDEDEDDDGPSRRPRPRVVGSDRPPVLFLLGLAGGAALLLGCCGVGGWGAYSALVGNSGGGWSLFGGNEVEITSANRTPTPFGGPQVSWTAVGKKTVPVTPNAYFLVMQCGGRAFQTPYPSPTKGMTDIRSVSVFEFRSVTGPLELWVEKRTNPNTPGTRVSNVYTVR